jgi:hypothetical protein
MMMVGAGQMQMSNGVPYLTVSKSARGNQFLFVSLLVLFESIRLGQRIKQTKIKSQSTHASLADSVSVANESDFLDSSLHCLSAV